MSAQLFYDEALFEIELVGDGFYVDAFYTVRGGFVYFFEECILEEDNTDQVPPEKDRPGRNSARIPEARAAR